MIHLKIYEEHTNEAYYKRYDYMMPGDLVKFQNRKDKEVYKIVKINSNIKYNHQDKTYYEIVSMESGRAENWVSTVRPLTSEELYDWNMKIHTDKYNL